MSDDNDHRPRILPSGFALVPGRRVFAIGDIHGRADLLREAIRTIEAHLTAHPVARHLIVVLGDIIDRGPQSREVIDDLIALGQRRELVVLKGNHETLIDTFLSDPATLSHWKKLGGGETLASYGLPLRGLTSPAQESEIAQAFRAAMPAAHHAFLARLPTSLSCGDLFFAHAGVRPGVALAAQSDHDLIWIRNDFLKHEELFEKLIIHGHTPVRSPDVRDNRINIDTGAYVTGRLSCMWIEEELFGFF